MATKTRKPSVSRDDFLRGYINGYKQGKTNEEVAEDLGMAPASVTSRASQLRSKLKEQGVELPFLKSERKSTPLAESVDMVKALLAETGDEKPVESVAEKAE